MKRLTFVMPAHGRLGVATVCIRQLRRTCNALIRNANISASAIIVADRDNLHALKRNLGDELLGFGYVVRDNQFLGRRFNDGFQFALDRGLNPEPADYVVPIGSDDWIDWRLLVDLPAENEVHVFQRLSYVREDGLELTGRHLGYEGGCGIRVYPRKLLSGCGFRPAAESRHNGCDTSTLVNLKRAHGHRMRIRERTSDPLQIIDWKTAGEQLHGYHSDASGKTIVSGDPFRLLRGVFPRQALAEMRAHYGIAA